MKIDITVVLSKSEAEAELAKGAHVFVDPSLVAASNVTIKIDDPQFAPVPAPFALSAPIPQKVLCMIEPDWIGNNWKYNIKNKIEAIKEVRAFYGWGLKDSKDYVEGPVMNFVNLLNSRRDRANDTI